MNDGDWMEAALIDESVVAELLLQLKHFSGPDPVDSAARQPQAKQILEGKGEPAVDSPSTPLSWSGGTTASGGGASDAEDSTRAEKAPGERSKKTAAGGKSSKIKKQRRRKTNAELKEQENFLLKERNLLQMELKTSTIDLKNQKVKNEQLKNIKLGGQSHQKEVVAPSVAFNSVADQAHEKKADCGPSRPSLLASTMITSGDAFAPHLALPEGSSNVQAVVVKEPKFLLPDLNLLPEEDFSD